MKLLTLNAHSIIGEDYPRRLDVLCDFLASEHPDFIAFQEASQTADATAVGGERLSVKYKAPSGSRQVPVREDNFALNLAERLRHLGVEYYFSWLPIKLGYGRLDEGLAFFSLMPIETSEGFFISDTRDYSDWRCRMALKVKVSGNGYTFYNIHSSRWDDSAEPYERQWKRILGRIKAGELVWLMGDFNNPAEVRNGGYDAVVNSGFCDSFFLADERRGGGTVVGAIDGWEDGDAHTRRIDFIFSNFRPLKKRLRYRTVLDDVDGERVSDHFGVMLEIF